MPQYEIELTSRARRAIHETLPAKVVDVVINFLKGPLAENPRRVGKKLNAPFNKQFSARRGDYRVIYKIDDELLLVTVLDIEHRAHAYAVRLKKH